MSFELFLNSTYHLTSFQLSFSTYICGICKAAKLVYLAQNAFY